MRKNIKQIINSLIKKKINLSVVESCTGGMLSSLITSVSGSSKVFRSGFITYSNQAKNKVLKVSNKIIKNNGAVSVQCCLSMVNNLSKITKSKLCISITGIAGPHGGTKHKPVGLVFIGLKYGKKIIVSKCKFKNKGRHFIRKKAVEKSLSLISQMIK